MIWSCFPHSCRRGAQGNASAVCTQLTSASKSRSAATITRYRYSILPSRRRCEAVSAMFTGRLTILLIIIPDNQAWHEDEQRGSRDANQKHRQGLSRGLYTFSVNPLCRGYSFGCAWAARKARKMSACYITTHSSSRKYPLGTYLANSDPILLMVWILAPASCSRGYRGLAKQSKSPKLSYSPQPGARGRQE